MDGNVVLEECGDAIGQVAHVRGDAGSVVDDHALEVAVRREVEQLLIVR